MDSKNLFEQAKHDGFATIYNDTPNEVVEKIKAYNEDMGVCRVNRKRAEKCAMTFTLINPIAAAVFFLGSMIAADHIAITVVTTAVFLAVYFVFTIMKRNLLVVSCASALLLLVSYWSLLLLAADLIIAVYHMNIESELKTHDGYSAFNDIRLIFSEKKTPVTETEGK